MGLGIAAGIVAAALIGGGAGAGIATAINSDSTPATVVGAQSQQNIVVNDTDSVNAITAAAAKAAPSVVTIQVAGDTGSGTGSGVILSEDGYILTNTHVVTLDGATGSPTIQVQTSDGKLYTADLIGTDPTTDLAVIKLQDATDLTPLDFGDSDELNVGDLTVAIGAPLGLSNTVTNGIVSALNRSIAIASSAAPDSSDDSGSQDDSTEGGRTPFDFWNNQEGQQQQSSASSEISIPVIQTDASINPGNSGGALVNAQGELIGINVAILDSSSDSSEAGSIGLGFAIPSNVAERIAKEIIDSGAATHGLLGAMVSDAASAEGATTNGALIQEATAGGAAAAAGLQAGDVVTAFDDVSITDATDLTAQVRAAAAGSDHTLTVTRDGKSIAIDVTLGTYEG
ncbi:PDZ domain-containing protein [Agromyces sp. MMS17-SY077]|uniref:PDZ domain-containing protein n=1 Tax=Agromyces seonyuensis TaxID=2662446 RepID=A0A6I4P454_9MICO|nr:PDZ domain-containing protein [Agromyces seonyuensis]